MAKWCSLTRVVIALAFLYLGYNLYTVYKIFNPASCQESQKLDCLTPLFTNSQKLQVQYYQWSSRVQTNDDVPSSCG